MIRVVLCDDHAVVRRGIRDTLAESPDIEVTAEAGSYPELREALRTAPCDILLLDLNMPGRSGLEVLASLKETHSSIKVLVVSMNPEAVQVDTMLRSAAVMPATMPVAAQPRAALAGAPSVSGRLSPQVTTGAGSTLSAAATVNATAPRTIAPSAG